MDSEPFYYSGLSPLITYNLVLAYQDGSCIGYIDPFENSFSRSPNPGAGIDILVHPSQSKNALGEIMQSEPDLVGSSHHNWGGSAAAINVIPKSISNTYFNQYVRSRIQLLL